MVASAPIRPPRRPIDADALSHAHEVLGSVCDPEIPVLTIADLGVLRDIELAADHLIVVLTPTYSGCPAMETISADVIEALARAGYPAKVRMVLDPPWTTDWLSEAGRKKLRSYGIAPPAAQNEGLFAPDPVIDCPHCGAHATRKISEFGSTACKALYTCDACQQPFDYFKCL